MAKRKKPRPVSVYFLITEDCVSEGMVCARATTAYISNCLTSYRPPEPEEGWYVLIETRVHDPAVTIVSLATGGDWHDKSEHVLSCAGSEEWVAFVIDKIMWAGRSTLREGLAKREDRPRAGA